MGGGVSVYIACDVQDKAIADVLQVYLEHRGLRCVRGYEADGWQDEATLLFNTMNACHILVVIDSKAFRGQAQNWELHYAQMLRKPLVVVSLHKAVDEKRSTSTFKLVDFSQEHDWQALLASITSVLG